MSCLLLEPAIYHVLHIGFACGGLAKACKLSADFKRGVGLGAKIPEPLALEVCRLRLEIMVRVCRLASFLPRHDLKVAGWPRTLGIQDDLRNLWQVFWALPCWIDSILMDDASTNVQKNAFLEALFEPDKPHGDIQLIVDYFKDDLADKVFAPFEANFVYEFFGKMGISLRCRVELALAALDVTAGAVAYASEAVNQGKSLGISSDARREIESDLLDLLRVGPTDGAASAETVIMSDGAAASSQGPNDPTTARPAESSRSPLTMDDKACAELDSLIAQGKIPTKAEIARRIRCHRSVLYRCTEFKKALATYHANRNSYVGSIPRGYRDEETGQIEAWADTGVGED